MAMAWCSRVGSGFPDVDQGRAADKPQENDERSSVCLTRASVPRKLKSPLRQIDAAQLRRN
jgi:hypothetical protein